MLQALSTTLGLRVFARDTTEKHLLWLLVEAVEAPLPPPFRWAIRARRSNPDEPHLVFIAPVEGFTDEGAPPIEIDEPHLVFIAPVEGFTDEGAPPIEIVRPNHPQHASAHHDASD
jgi:hypothetical protein